jgi:nickel/cobalt exporter
MPLKVWRQRAATAALILAVTVIALHAADALAQARNPFNVGISEGGGQASGVAGWILAKQIEFERMMSATVRAVRTSPAALWTLVGISFAYGVFHAAGPGHGKAVVASYMLANERALRRGLVISFLAALLQGIVAMAIVGGLAVLLNATAAAMRQTASLVEIASFSGIMLLGAWLTWRKGRAFLQAWRLPPKRATASIASRFACEACDADAEHEHGPDCGHVHMPDPRTLGDSFSWRDATLTVMAAGARPCSGAILVLVFALAQGVFYAGVLATFAMALGTAITTGALAALAVLAKGVALRLTKEGTPSRVLIARGLELVAAVLVFLLGLALLLGYTAAGI